MLVTATIWSTTHTAPIHITRISATQVFIQTEDGAAQTYNLNDILNALEDQN